MTTKKKAADKMPLVSIIIPVKNGMPRLKDVLTAVAQQKFEHSFEVIIIDSRSTDGSVRAVRNMDNRFKLVQIKPWKFGHGKTRNFGAKLARGRFCAYLTHDATPANEHWLTELVQPLLQDDKVAGVFGRHIAYPQASPFTKHELEGHFDGLNDWSVVQMSDAPDYDDNEEIRKVYHFYSDNSSCLRRSVWQTIPYPEVDFAEDQAWAKLIIEAGHKKAYAHRSVVYHSHDYSLWERLQRAYDEARALRELFGYEYSNSLWRSIQLGAYYSWKDMGIAWRKSWFLAYPLWVLTRPGQNLARAIGHYLGTTNPDFLRRFPHIIPLDKKGKATSASIGSPQKKKKN